MVSQEHCCAVAAHFTDWMSFRSPDSVKALKTKHRSLTLTAGHAWYFLTIFYAIKNQPYFTFDTTVKKVSSQNGIS